MSEVVFSLNNILYSIGFQIKKLFNNRVYINPNQQSTELPCFFVQLVPTSHLQEGISKDIYNLQFDIIYLIDINDNNQYTKFYDIINILDANMHVIPYHTDEEKEFGNFTLHNPSFTTELGKLSYKANGLFRVKIKDIDKEPNEKLKKLIFNLTLLDKDKKIDYIKNKKISY